MEGKEEFMIIKGIIDESFVDYKKPAMYIVFPKCTFKCDKINNCKVCQNSHLANEKEINITKEELIERYLDNPITQAIVLSGLEPFDSMLDVTSFIDALRNKYECNDDVIIYTGYTIEEIEAGYYGDYTPEIAKNLWNFLTSFSNIYVKFGRFILNEEPHYDEVLGIKLASSNQYGKKVSRT